MVERALSSLEAAWGGDPLDPALAVVRLRGLSHSDERVAFQEAARQLCA
jgi:hypothetical protein